MTEDDDPTLLSIAEAVTDGMSVDWKELGSRNPGLLPDLEAMKEMATVAFAYRELRESGAGA